MTRTVLLSALASAFIGALALSGGEARAATPGPALALVRSAPAAEPARMMRSRRMVTRKRGRAIGTKKGL